MPPTDELAARVEWGSVTDQKTGQDVAPADSRRMSLPRALVTAMRPKQWAKNVLVFVAPAAAGVIDAIAYYLRLTLVGFVAFCMVSSATYLLNDILDVESDRRHPTKRRRPIARGRRPGAAGLRWPSCCSSGGRCRAGGLRTTGSLAVVVAGYAVLTTTYSLWLKTIPVLDLVILSGGFILRLLGGAYAAEVEVSDWFLIISLFGSLFIAAAKRFAEKVELGESAASLRPTLGEYSIEYLGLVRASRLAARADELLPVGGRDRPTQRHVGAPRGPSCRSCRS